MTPFGYMVLEGAVRITTLVAFITVVVLAVLQKLTTVIGDALRGAVATGMDRHIHIGRLSGRAEGKSGKAGKYNLFEAEAHRKPPL
jgi:hypothetical protein